MAMSQPTSSQLAHPRPQSQRRPWLWLGLPIAITATAAGSYWAMQPTRSKTFTGANLLPPNTLVATTLVVDRSEWQRLRQLGTPPSRALLEQQLATGSKEWLGDLPVADLANWMGRNVYLAQLPNNQNVALLPIRTQAPASSGQARQYKGIAIYETKKVARAEVATKAEKFLVVGNAQAIEQVIDTWKSGQSLAKSAGYAQAQTALPNGDAIGQVYFNLPGLLGNKKGLTSQGLLIDLMAKDQVVTGRGVLWGSRPLATSTRSPEMAQLVPAQAMVLMTGSSLARLWQDYAALATTGAPIAPTTLQQNLKNHTGLNLETDILKWGGGEFAFALVPQSTDPANASKALPTNGGLLLLHKSTDRPATERAMTTLDQAMAKKQYQVTSGSFQNTPIVQWSTKVGGVQGTHGWLAEDLAFLAMGAPLADQFVPKPKNALRDRAEFQQVMQSQIAPFDGQFYLDVAQMITTGNIVPSQFPANTQTLLLAIQSIGLTSNGTTSTGEFKGNQQRLDLSVSLKFQPDATKTTP
jgi:Protein of unknown function (DUF3352)